MAWTVAIGVDTHKDLHVAVACDRLGGQLDTLEIAAGAGGYLALLEWARQLGEPAFAIEGTGSYGAGLTRFLQAAGVTVYECERPRRQERRRGKSDLIDAALAARRLIAGNGLSQPRGGGPREDLRALLVERRSATQARTAALNQVHSLLVTAPDALRERLGQLTSTELLTALTRLRSAKQGAIIAACLRRLGQRIGQLEKELAALEQELARIISALAPQLLAECGVGPLCASQLIVSSGDPGRMGSEASFAALAGTSPVDASSGRQQRHRLNRGGDRQLNSALHVIALNRIRHHPETAAYHARLLKTGKTTREARRCIKRALARHFYRHLREIPDLALTP